MNRNSKRDIARLSATRIDGAIAFLKEMQEESDLRFEPEDPYQTAIDDLRSVSNFLSIIDQERDTAERQLSAWMANVEEPQKIDIDDLEDRIAKARANGRDHVAISARDLWRMASDRRGRDEE